MLGRLGTFLLVVCGVAPLAAAVVIDDFDRADPGMPSSPAVTISLADAEAPGVGKALSVAWPLPHKAFVEANYATPLPLPTLKPDEGAAVRFDAWLPASPCISVVALRLLDAHGQIFQWMIKLAPSADAGWRKVSIPLDTAHAAGNWGGPNDGRMAYPAKLFGLTLAFSNDAVPAGHVLIDNLAIEPVLTLALEADRFPSLVNTGPNGKCDLLITNPFDHPVEVKLTGTLADFSGAKSNIATSVSIPANGKSQIPLPLADRRPGIRYFDATAKFDDSEIGYKASFIIADPVDRTGGSDFRFGICSHMEHASAVDQEREMQAAAAAGANEMRVSDAWAHIQPKPDVWRWDTQDRIVDLAAKYGIETQPILGFSPSWAIPEAQRNEQAEAYKQHKPDAFKISLFGAPEEAPWRAYVSAMVTRYRGKIKRYEIWNEPDLTFWRGTTEDYLRTLRAGAQEIRRADPDAKVMTGGFATVLPHAARAKNPDLQERVLAEAPDAFDIHAVHQHGPFSEFKLAITGELARIRARMPSPKPLYFNETAFSSAYGGERLQAITLVKKMAFAMAHGAVGYTWYDLRNDGTNPAEGEHNYGLLTTDFQPKASFAAYSEYVRQLQGMHYLGDIDLGPDREAHVFGGPRGRVLVWWNEGHDTSPLPMLFHAGSQPLRTFDVMGTEADLPPVNGVVLAQPSADPQYVLFPPGDGLPAIDGQLVKFNGPAQAAVGQPLSVTAVVTNPWPRPIKVNLAWQDAAGKPMTAAVAVPANAVASQPIVTKPATPRSVVHGVDVSYAVVDIGWEGKTRFSAPVTRVVAAAPPDGRIADWVLDTRADVVSFTQADPALSALNWRGPDDLSARIWLWQQDDAFRIRVDVRDDIHVQKERPDQMWRGDSIQVAFQPVSDKAAYTELGVASADDGTLLQHAWAAPAGVTNPDSAFTAACTPITGGLRYELTIPRKAFSLTDAALRDGLRFNLIVNDNDGNLRESFVRIAPGLGESKDVSAFPVIYCSNPPASH